MKKIFNYLPKIDIWAIVTPAIKGAIVSVLRGIAEQLEGAKKEVKDDDNK